MIHILDDIVDETTQDLIESLVFSESTKWTFSRSIAYKNHPEVSKETVNKLLGFSNVILINGEVLDPTNINIYCSVLAAMATRLNINTPSVFNIRTQLSLPTPPTSKYGSVHVDCYIQRPYKVCLYYVNDSDGDTILFKQTTKNTSAEQIKAGELEEAARITPKRGRLVVFDGDIYHTGSKPSKDVRCLINYNIVLND